MGAGKNVRFRMRSAVPAVVGAALLAVGLTSCGGTTATQSLPCPMVKVIPDASYLTKFAGESEDLTETAYEAKIAVVGEICHYVVEKDTGKTTIRSEFSVQVMASRGPKLTGDKADIVYNVSVTGPGGSHVGDAGWIKPFTVSIPLTADKPTNGIADSNLIQIPLPNKNENGDFYQIHVSLQLTEKELAYNRRNPQQ